MLGGPLGAVFGAALGHNFDRGLGNIDIAGGLGGADVERIQSAFFTATFSMMGYIAKSDGQVSKVEISVAQNIMQQMQLNSEQKKVAINLFKQGKKSDFPVNDILQQFKQECHRRRNLMQMFIEILVMTALADGHLHPAENKILNNSAQVLGFSAREYQEILRRIQAQNHYHQGRAGRAGSVESTEMSLTDAYKLLGISRSVSDVELKKAYRRQMNQHHPDKLVSKGLPQEMMDIATQKTQDIKAAYDLIKKSRKL
ncbi:co-chaperone DjlA [Gammaproteobacteria bacterium]|nr:co-chaperone DjlA [Gammaproteobacteria bacterium]